MANQQDQDGQNKQQPEARSGDNPGGADDPTGGTIDGDVGIRAFPESAGAADQGPRGKN